MRYAIAFASIAIGLAMLAFVHGGLHWLWIWPALSFAWVSAAYFFDAPIWLGKRRDGTIRPSHFVLLLPFFLYTWLTWYLLTLFSREPVANEVVPGLWVGRRPLSGELPSDVSVVVDVAAEFFEVRSIVRAVHYLSFPMLDATIPSVQDFNGLMEAISGKQGTIFVHCAQGHGRSATVAAAILLQRGLCSSIDECESLLKRARPKIALNPVQRNFIKARSA